MLLFFSEFFLIFIQLSNSHPINKRCLASPCRDEAVSPNIKVLLETVDDETRKPVQRATGYYIAHNNYSLSLTPPPVTPTPYRTVTPSSPPRLIPPSPYQSPPIAHKPPYSTLSPHSFHFIPPSSSPSSPIVASPIFIRSDTLPPSSPPFISSVYKNPSGVVRPSSQLQPPFVVVKMKKVSTPPPIEIITTPRSQATLTPTTTVSPSMMTLPMSTSTATVPVVSYIPPLRSLNTVDRSTTTEPVTDRVETSATDAAAATTTESSLSQLSINEDELRKKVAAMLDKNQLLCTMFGICNGVTAKDIPDTVTPKTVYNPNPAVNFQFIPRIVNAPTTPSPFQFVFEFASTLAPTLQRINKQVPLFSAQYASNPSPIMPHPKSLNPNTLSLSSLLSSIVSSPLASHCPSCVQLLLNLCPTEGRTSRDCVITTTTPKPPPPPLPTPFSLPIRPQNTFAFSFPNPITGQRIDAAAVVPTTTTLRPWQTTYNRHSPSTTTFDPFAPLADDEMQYDFDFDKRPVAEIQYDEGGGYGLVGERRGVLPWSIKRAG